jgi:hypothetical protein
VSGAPVTLQQASLACGFKQDSRSHARVALAPKQNIENNPMQSSMAVAGKEALGQYLTRRANQRHSFIIAQSIGRRGLAMARRSV